MQFTDLLSFLETIYPLSLSEGFDNTGLLLGDRNKTIRSVMTCLTVTPESAQEAASKGADVIVSHHPFPFHSGKRYTSDTPDGRLLLRLAEAKIAIYSPHTAHDSALFGVNEQIARLLELQEIEKLTDLESGTKVIADSKMLDGGPALDSGFERYLNKPLGAGRIGNFSEPMTLQDVTDRVHKIFHCDTIQVVGGADRPVRRLAIGCGAAEVFLHEAVKSGADAFLVGEGKFHFFLEAAAESIALIMPGHFYTERFAMSVMSERIERRFPDLIVWASQSETDPIRYSSKKF